MKKNFFLVGVLLLSLLCFFSLWYTLFVLNNSFIWNIDIQINSHITNFHSEEMVNKIFIILTSIFDPKIFFSWFLVLLGVLWFRNQRFEVLFLFFGVGGGQTVKIIMKNLTDRARPENPFLLSAHESSFPSGHSTTATFFFLAILYLFSRKIPKNYQIFKMVSQIFLLAGIFLVPFSRVFVQVHYTSDVIAGILLGIGSFAFTVLVFSFWEKMREQQ